MDDNTYLQIEELRRIHGGDYTIICKLLGRIDSLEENLNRVRESIGVAQRQTLDKELTMMVERNQ